MKYIFPLELPCISDCKESALQETRVLSLGWQDPLEKGMAIRSSILAWRIQWTEETGGLQSMESQRIGYTCATNTIITTTQNKQWEKAMAPHSSTLAWKIPWTEEPGRLQSMGSLRVGPD